MKRKYYITPSTLFTSGTAERLLGQLDAGPIGYDAQGRIIAHLAPHQVDLWTIKGGAHRLELAPEVEPEPAASTPAVVEPEIPSIIVETSPGEGKVVKINKGA